MAKLLIAACVAATLSSACSIDVNAEGALLTEVKTFQVTGQPELRLHTFDGSIDLRSWDRNEVSVEIRRRAASDEEARALEVTTTQDGNRIVVEAPGDNSRRRVIRFGSWADDGVSFIVRVPRQITLDAETRDGSIAVEDLAGTVSLQSGDGSIRGSRVEGVLTARTGDGSIAISDASGRVNLDSGDGSIRLTGRIGDLSVHTGDGSVIVDVAGGSTMNSDWSLTSGDGSITVNLPAPFDAAVEAQSGDGRIRLSGPGVQATQTDDQREFRGQLGSGGRILRARSGDGSISITSR